MHTALAVTHVAFEDLGSLGIELTHAGFNIELIDACTTNIQAIDALDPDLMSSWADPSVSMSRTPILLSKPKSNCCGRGLPQNARHWVFVSARS
jgi:hypothetical protein